MLKTALFSLKIFLRIHVLFSWPNLTANYVFLYCYFRGDVASMTIRQELAMLPLYDVSSAALYLTVQLSCCHSYEATAVRRFLPLVSTSYSRLGFTPDPSGLTIQDHTRRSLAVSTSPTTGKQTVRARSHRARAAPNYIVGTMKKLDQRCKKSRRAA